MTIFPLPWPLLRPYTGRYLALLLVILAGAVAEAGGLVLLSGLLNIFLGASAGIGSAKASILAPMYEFARANPPRFLMVLVAVYLAKSLLAIVGTYGSFSLALSVTRDWQIRLVRGLLRTPLGRLDTRQGGVVQIVLDETGVAASGLGAAGVLIQNVLATATVYIVLLYVSVWVTLGLTVMAALAMLIVAAVSRLSVRLGKERYRVFVDAYAYVTELASAIKQYRALGLEEKAEAVSAEHFAQTRAIQLKVNMASASPRLFIEVLFLFGLAAAVIMLVPRMNDTSVLSALGLAVMATVRLLPSFTTSANTWVQFHQSFPAFSHVAAELDRLEAESRVAAHAFPGKPVTFSGHIALQDVSFAYPGREAALVGATIEIPCGKVTAIAGPSGSGKSTTVDLICGFYEPERGAVTIDGLDLRDADLTTWRGQLGIVLQDSFLLSGTIRDNLTLLRPDCSPARLDEIVRLVGADSFISELPDGLDTVVGERGLRLSGGQRQRIALARVLLREPNVLILDEAMSALDVQSEEMLQERIAGLSGDMTVIVISHRITALRRADHIYVLDAGRVVESGSHQSLLAHDGLYAGMLRASQLTLA